MKPGKYALVVPITVTEQDIKRGVPYAAALCPVARATRRALGGRYVVNVNTRRVLITRPEKGAITTWFRAQAPAKIINFVERFDVADVRRRRELKPFSATLRFVLRSLPE